jgi:hypothetical protein
MKAIYIALMGRLKELVPELKWIDLDTGQIDTQNERPGVAFPCALINIALTLCEDICETAQLCRASVTVRIAQNPIVIRTNSQAATQVRETALEAYTVIDKIYEALQGFSTPEFNPLSRKRQQKENRQDGLFIYKIEFETEFEEIE